MLTVAGTLLLAVIGSVPRKQRLTICKEDASSPTVSVEALMLSCMIDDMVVIVHVGLVGRSNGGTTGQVGPKVVSQVRTSSIMASPSSS